MTSKGDPPSGVRIGNVSGGIQGSIIAGRDVSNAMITLGGRPTPADKQPTVDELKQLLAEIQQELAEITAQKEALKAVSPAASFMAQGVEQSVKDVVEKVEPGMKPDEAKLVQNRLNETTNLLSGILDGAKTMAQKVEGVGIAVKPIAAMLEPLVEKAAVAALWVAKLWLNG